MKMKLSGFLAFALLSISILSYGVSDVAFAATDPNPALPISTNIDIVSNGATVTITGSIKDYDSSSGKGLTFLVLSPDNAIVQIGQLTSNQISSDGSFTKSFVAGGTYWKNNGDYVVEFHYGADESKVIIDYVGGSQVISGQPDPITCPSGQTLVNGKCISSEPPVTCPSGQTLVNGKCMTPEPEPPVTCPSGQELVNGKCMTPEPDEPTCGAGTQLVNGICQVISAPPPPDSGCLIATAAYGTELAPQVQLLREIRDNTLFSTSSGTAFMGSFNTLYYSFAPTVADWERESPVFKEIVKTAITPMLSTLSIMSLANEGSEVEVLGLGISVIALNLGMYIAAPALIGFKVNQIIKSRK
ncbi:MAG: EB domain-containing protein [Candidatus Nitrosopumilus sp. bin_7KS]